MKKLILVASPPSCGKTYVSEKIAKALGNIVYLDKDDLAPIVRACFAVSGNEFDMDGDFYKQNIRSLEYETILGTAFSALRFSDTVLLNAPLGREVRNGESMKSLKVKANEMDAELILIWVLASPEVCFERMKKRNFDRDTLKLAAWEEYVKKINYNPPSELMKENAVDKLIVFDNSDHTAFDVQLKEVLKAILLDSGEVLV